MLNKTGRDKSSQHFLRNGDSEVNVVIVTMDTHLSSAASRAKESLRSAIPGLTLKMFAASEYVADNEKLQSCINGIKNADIVLVTMLFVEEHFKPILEALEAKRLDCDAMVCIMSAPEVSKITSMGKLDMSKPVSGAMGFLKRLCPCFYTNEHVNPGNEINTLYISLDQ